MASASVVVIGNFDGVHLGHQEVLRTARTLEPDARLAAVTFWPHPVSVVRPGTEPKLLTDLPERVRLLRAAGADEVRVIQFNKDVAALSPRQFVDRFLRPLQPARVVVGANFRFGKGAAGDVNTLRELGAGTFGVTELELLVTDHQLTSSTEIRRLLTEGSMREVSDHLGRPFTFSGTVVVGHQRGRELGFPTANLPVPKGFAAPADGVYAGRLRRTDEPEAGLWPAAISVGTNPTFDDVADVVVEAHVLDRLDLQLYGAPVTVSFIERLRGNVRFEGIPALIEQIATDVEDTRRILAAEDPGQPA